MKKAASGKPARSAVRAPAARPAPTQDAAIVNESALLSDLRSLIQSARQRIASAAYATQTLLSWHLGRRLLSENLQGARAAYGKQILVTVSRELAAEYGRGFSYAELARMVQFVQQFPDEPIVVTLSQQLSWSHFHALLPIKDPLVRDFYAETCRIERWDVRTLRQKIGGMLFERTALSKQLLTTVATEIAKLRGGQVELLQLDAKSIRVSEYLTDLPPLPLLRERLHHAIEHARESAAQRPTAVGWPL
jgi:hypothetical protein